MRFDSYCKNDWHTCIPTPTHICTHNRTHTSTVVCWRHWHTRWQSWQAAIGRIPAGWQPVCRRSGRRLAVCAQLICSCHYSTILNTWCRWHNCQRPVCHISATHSYNTNICLKTRFCTLLGAVHSYIYLFAESAGAAAPKYSFQFGIPMTICY